MVFKHLILATLRKKRRCVKKRDVYNFTKDSVIASIEDIQKVRVMLLNEKYNWRSILLQVCPLKDDTVLSTCNLLCIHD
jgi:hypothetical protein